MATKFIVERFVTSRIWDLVETDLIIKKDEAAKIADYLTASQGVQHRVRKIVEKVVYQTKKPANNTEPGAASAAASRAIAA